MSWQERVEQLRRTGFVRTLRTSLLELLDELLVLAGFVLALFAGFYYRSWWIFGGTLLLAYLVSVLVRLILGRDKEQ